MIKLNYLYATLFVSFYITIFFLIKNRAALVTSNLASVLNTPTPCRYHILFNKMSTSDLPTTRKVPLTLSKRDFPDDFNPWVVPINVSSKLDILQNRGWLCEILILFVFINSPSYTKSHQRVLGCWITTQSRDYLTLNKKIDLRVYPDFHYFILIPSSPETLESFKNFPLYVKPFPVGRDLPVKFAVIFFLPGNKVTSCYQKSIPILQNFVCTTTTLIKDTILFDPLNYPTRLEQYWLDNSEKHPISGIVFDMALTKLNASRHFWIGNAACYKVLTEPAFIRRISTKVES